MGPLEGVRVVEIAGIGPGPFCAMMLADMGADVVRVDRATAVRGGDPGAPPADVMSRGRRSVGVDLKSDRGVDTVLRLVDGADALLEGFRPGVAERLGIGPEECLARNPGLVYGRVTGWGQDGPYALSAGHDINFISLAGALEPMGRRGQPPVPPLNLVGDFGGGGMMLAFGLVCGILEARTSGRGQVVDAAMVDGAATLMTMFHGMRAMGVWNDERGTNLLDTGAHFYDIYETADGKYVTIAPIEPQFWAVLMEKLGLDAATLPDRDDASQWDALIAILRDVFLTKTRDEWQELLEGTDACFAPVYRLSEAHEHPHNVARGLFRPTPTGGRELVPIPRFSRTPGQPGPSYAYAGADTEEVLGEFGFDHHDIAKLRAGGAVA